MDKTLERGGKMYVAVDSHGCAGCAFKNRFGCPTVGPDDTSEELECIAGDNDLIWKEVAK